MLRFTSSNYNFVSECRSSVIIVIFSRIYKAIRDRIGLDLPCSVIGAGLTALGHYWLSLVFFFPSYWLFWCLRVCLFDTQIMMRTLSLYLLRCG